MSMDVHAQHQHHHMSPSVTIKRHTRSNKQWQDFIDREQSSVDQLIEDSFAEYCRKREQQNQQERFSSLKLRAKERLEQYEANNKNSDTLPLGRRNSEQMKKQDDINYIEELENLYAPMKNLLQPLPHARKYSGNTMPELHPLSLPRNTKNKEDDLESEAACSVVIPPPLAPVQSHAVLEESLGHELPRTPLLRSTKFDFGRQTPPLPPRRTTGDALKHRPNQLNLNSAGVYANSSKILLHRTSLMSTGSSENSTSDSSLPSFDPEGILLHTVTHVTTPTSPAQSSKTTDIFSWANTSVSKRSNHNFREDEDEFEDNLRSVSQIGEPPGSSANSDCSGNANNLNTSLSDVYIRMFGKKKSSNTSTSSAGNEAHYMNLLYNAVQRQGGQGSVEDAISPYLSMTGKRSVTPNSTIRHKNTTVRRNPNVSVDGIYAEPLATNKNSPDKDHSSKCRVRSSSASRILEDIPTRVRRKKLNSSSTAISSSSAKSKALAEYKELLREVEIKRHFRVGLNLFNSKPEMGIEYLCQKEFIELSPSSIAKFLQDNPGLSKEKIGEYLGELQNPFAMRVLSFFMQHFDFSGLRLDKALRVMLSKMRIPGEAQKIERIVEEFGKRYGKCNPSVVAKFRSSDSIITLAFAVILLNTDLHSPNLKEEKKMSLDDFINNLRGVDGGKDFDSKLLKSIYKGIKKQEFVCGSDHVLQTHIIHESIQGTKKPFLPEPHRRLVCVCRLNEVVDLNTKKEDSCHQRDIFLFNDMLVMTKQVSLSSSSHVSSPKSPMLNMGLNKSACAPVYTLRDYFGLTNLEVTLFQTPIFKFGIQISEKSTEKILLTLNAGSEHDRYKFVMDLQESIFEMDLTEKVLKELSR